MTDLTFTHTSREDGALRQWELRGPAGMVRFETADALGLRTQSIYLHSATPPFLGELEDCVDCGRCWHDAAVGKYARALRDEWELRGCDDEVIRRVLADWYARELMR